ncbi:MAG TPA: NlpC/P60 family protein [Xanthobacteraceae bacterium]|jgi:cell wall-associated NlpC family hydrolase
MKLFDPRTTPARPDLAAAHLEGKVTAARFVAAEPREVIAPTAPLRHAPSPDAALDTEALKGERVAVYETSMEGWAWGQLEADGYVGFIPAGALRDPGPAPTHKVTALRTLVFPGPSIKLPPVEALALGSRLAIARIEGPFAVAASGGYLPARHLAAIDSAERDFVAVAERFLGTPYLWGGKTSLGLDCSGLVQVALTACGVACPRDSDMQEKALGETLTPPVDLSRLKRGDLLFWKGHVAIVHDAATLVHANAFHMAVTFEPIAEAIVRIRATGSEVTSVRRLALRP